MLDFETCYRAMASRDQRFDGRFVVAVTSTGIYCRPACPSRTPKRANTRFFPIPAAAEVAGYRACRRCRPDSAPGSPEWNARSDLVARASRMIAAGVVDEVGVGGLARRLAVSERHLHRQMVAEVGVGPQALALSRRAHVARLLVEACALSLADVAFAAGYSSIRQFNHGMRVAFGKTPRELRTGTTGGDEGGPLTVRLRFRPPLAADALLCSFASEALPGIEALDGAGYRRTVRLPRAAGRIALAAVGSDHITVELRLGDLRDVAAAVQRCRDLLDLDADPHAVAADLGRDPLLGPLVTARPGLRVPGCVDGFELAVRAVLRQHCSTAAAQTLAGRLLHRFGEPMPAAESPLTHLFPTADALAAADFASTGLGPAPAATIRALAELVAAGRLQLDRQADHDETVAQLRELPGIDESTAGQVAMRALGDPDAFPASDLALRTAAERLGLPPADLGRRAERWRPWRSYAAMQLWASRPRSPAAGAP